MGKRNYDDWLAAFLRYADSSETPIKMLYWSGVSAIAGALQRRVYIDQGRFQLYPNFYIVLVAEPGVVQKSTTINFAIDLLKKVEGIKFAPKSCTWEAFIRLMEDGHQTEQDGFDISTEFTKNTSITVTSPEFSVFLDPTNLAMVSALTELWDCPDVFDKVTKFSGSERLEKPCVNLIAGTTPAWIRQSFDRWSREGGFVSRCIFLYEKEKRQLKAFPDKIDRAMQKKLIEDLWYMSRLDGEFKLTPEAIRFEEERYAAHYAKLASGEFVATSGFRDRKQAHILKLSIVISASRRDSKIITLDDIKDAEAAISLAESDFPKVFSVLDDRPEIRPFADFKEVISFEKRIRKETLYRRFTDKYLVREMNDAIAALLTTEQIAAVNEDGRTYYLWKGD